VTSPARVGPGSLSGVLVDPAWRARGIATALTRARLRWAFARTSTVFYVTGADNAASLHLHAALGFQEIKRFESERVRSWRGRAVATSEDGGRHRQRVTARVDPLAAAVS